MESQSQNPEFRTNPENFHSCLFVCLLLYVPSQQLWSWWDSQFTLPHFFLGKLEQVVNQYFVYILSLVTDNNPWMIQRKEGE